MPNHSSTAVSQLRFGMALVALLIATLIPVVRAQDEQSCRGLHAGIKGQVVRQNPSYSQPPFVMLTFILLNDSEKPLDSAEESWRIVIDGKELKDSDFIFGNGPAPTSGWGTLQPGESYEFGKALELGKYFPQERAYQVFWKGKGFRSSTVTVNVILQR